MRSLTEEDLVRMRVPNRYWRLDPAKITDKVYLNYLRSIVENINKGLGLYLYGANGVGKTTFGCAAVMHARRNGFTSLFVESSKLKEYAFEHTPFDDSSSYWDRMLNVKLLMIDDFGKDRPDQKNWQAQLMDEIIRHRTLFCLSTIITSNIDKENLTNFLERSTLEAMKDSVTPYNQEGSNLRVQNAKDNRAALIG